jgi:hypothetical protein
MKQVVFALGLALALGLGLASLSAFAAPKGFTVIGVDETGTTWSIDETKTTDLVLEKGNSKLPVRVFYVSIDQGERHAEGYSAAICSHPGSAMFTGDPTYDYKDLHPMEYRLQQWAEGEVPFQMLAKVCKR